MLRVLYILSKIFLGENVFECKLRFTNFITDLLLSLLHASSYIPKGPNNLVYGIVVQFS